VIRLVPYQGNLQMLVRPIFSPPIKSRNPKGRRPRAGCLMQLEALENRTPLSAGLGGGVESVLVLQAAEIARSVPATIHAIEWATFVDSGQATMTSGISTLTSDLLTSSSAPASEFPAASLIAALVPSSSSEPLSPAVASSSVSLGALDGISVSASTRTQQAQRDAGGELSGLLSAFGPSLRGVSISPPPDLLMADRFDDGGEPPPLYLIAMGSNVFRPTSSNDDGTDMTFAGPLEDFEALASSSPWMTTPLSTGHATGHSWSFLLTEPSVQVDADGDVPAASGLSYLASAEWSTLESAPSAAAVDDVLAWEDSSTEPALPVSITAGGVSLNILLGGPDIPSPNDSRGVEQVALLVPLPETSLALAATLWTVSSESPSDAPRKDVTSTEPTNPAAQAVSTSAWALFVTGMDQALEQTCRDIREGMFSSDGRPSGDQSPSRRRQDELIEWQGPILPAAQTGSPVNEPGTHRPGLMTARDAAGNKTEQTPENSRRDSSEAPRVVLGGIPMLSVASVAGVIAGWFWQKRQRRQMRTSPSDRL
jgi:hypothetical protein